MAWIVATTLLLFYALGIWVFHATGPVRFLPLIAIIVIVVDRWLIWTYSPSDQSMKS